MLTQSQALRAAFGEHGVERRTAYLTKEQVEQAAAMSGCPHESAVVSYYLARSTTGLIGAAFFESHRLRDGTETIMVVLSPDGRLVQSEILSFNEPADYLPHKEWRTTSHGGLRSGRKGENMKSVFLSTGLLLAASSAVSAAPAAKAANGEAAVLAAVSAYRSAIAVGSLDKLAAIVEPDLSVQEGMHLNRGWADYRDNHIGPEMKEWKEFRVTDPSTVEVTVAGDWAYVLSRATYTIVLPGKAVVLDSAETFVLRRREGAWRVRHVHSSSKKLREEKS
ncbi:MAG: nuclear transport factor 2 family protein [Elusimicrobia bacterium]|nr:nuclear transport factor 2 family protein [Elusimicrobiota bacterium]